MASNKKKGGVKASKPQANKAGASSNTNQPKQEQRMTVAMARKLKSKDKE